ncbi:J domain-containing protein [Calothrix sp. 336/3]|uniref:J domain-containing protein n=1 Tax=Calothrix sp. 336/3 TaxID=1337936 RepID=UPI0004E3D222|nr:J domain-containing protein [Calothrix sp. 336/3]AKG20978.1 molecular chaperone DnaJ [Calothrix sp. 336/3]
MTEANHYHTLKVNQNASQAEIKQAYRRLAKMFHPDSSQETDNHEEIIRINAAYEVLGDIQNRQSYDRQLQLRSQSSQTVTVQQTPHKRRQTGKDVDELVEEWLRLVYQPVNRIIKRILSSLKAQINKLAADPFDDDLLAAFQEYLDDCRSEFKQAQTKFRSLPNPPSLARTAAHIYYCLNQINDGLDELQYFALNYDDSYLHAGQEMFRIAKQLHREAQESVN